MSVADWNGTPDQHAAIAVAMADWNTASAGVLAREGLTHKPSLSPEANASRADVVVYFVTDPSPKWCPGITTTWSGCTTHSAQGSLVVVLTHDPLREDRQAYSADALREIVRHELGHALGLHHTTASGAWMNPTARLD